MDRKINVRERVAEALSLCKSYRDDNPKRVVCALF